MPNHGSTAWLILLCGLPGSGKTTIGRQLETELDAVRFCPDEWMAKLGIDLFDQRARAEIESIQWQLAQRLLRNGDTVVIEWGVWTTFGARRTASGRTGPRGSGRAAVPPCAARCAVGPSP